MNLPDLCPEGIEKWTEYIAAVLEDDNRARIEADQAYKQHIQDCELCGGQDE